MKEKQSTDTLFYKVTQYIYYFFSLNLFFLLCNSLFIITLLSFPLSLSNLIPYAVTLIPAGASITGLFYTMGKLNREKSISPAKDFFKSYRDNFKQSTFYWALFLIISVVLIVDILFVIERGWLMLTVISVILFLIVILSAIYAFTLLSRFEVTFKNLVLFSVYLVFKYKRATLSHAWYLVAFSLIGYGFFRYALFFIFSISVFYFMRTNEGIMKTLKQEFSKNEEERHV
ncbi:MAG: YesL family protein [Alkalibacterium sp.]|nr:YesL family protein [Alkalibacterium sp.]